MAAAEDRVMNWDAVRSALSDERWDFRTVQGIIRDTGLSESAVRNALEVHRSEIRQTISRDRRPVFRLKSRPMKMREIVADLQLFASKNL